MITQARILKISTVAAPSIPSHIETVREPLVAKTIEKTVATNIDLPTSKTGTGGYGITLGGLKNIKKDAREKHLAESGGKVAIEITNENLALAWNDAVDKIAAHKMLYKSAILESVLTFQQHEITIHANVVSFDFLKSERLQLLDFFKLYFHNESINVLFAAKVSELEKKGEQVMSTREIFDMMAEKNPNLRLLKDKLGLDIEY